MRMKKKLWFFLLASGLALGQASSPDQNSQSADSSASVADDLKALRESITRHQQQIAAQQQRINTLKKELNTSDSSSAISPRLIGASLTTTSAAQPNAQPVNVTTAVEPQEKPKESPLSFRIGGADFTPGGFVDFENIFRSTNTGNVAATNFWAIPFSNTQQGHLTEYRSTGQYSRFNIKTHANYGRNDITGYVEFDFNSGIDPGNVFVTSNSHGNRIRLYWLDLKRGKWEFLGGQTWGLQTPNRVGLSPNPSDVFVTIGADAQVHVGVNYTRAAEFRVVYHANDHWALGMAIQNPQQFGGQGAEVLFPAIFNAQLGVQLDQGALPGTPNLVPDVHSKIAFDKDVLGGRHFHWEGGGIMTTAKTTVLAGPSFNSHIMFGGGGESALNFELLKGSEGRNLRFVANGMWGYGIGRYLIGMGPDLVTVPVPVAGAPGVFDIRNSGVHSGDALAGFEFTPVPKSQFGVYGGVAYFQRNAFPDITAGGAVKPIIGFGGVGETQGGVNLVQNRALQEATIDWTQTFWRNPQYGAVLLVTQASYVSRSIWFPTAGAPKNAHLGMGYVSLRYVLP